MSGIGKVIFTPPPDKEFLNKPVKSNACIEEITIPAPGPQLTT